MADKLLYFDNAANSFVHPNILESYQQFISLYPGNPGSIHRLGQDATRMINKSRDVIFGSLGLKNDFDVIFTSGATEANNLALKGICLAYKHRGKHIIVSEIEHPSILETARELERDFGYKVTYLHIKSDGKVDLDELKNEICDDTIIVSIMAVNNEIGSVNDINSIATIVHSHPKIIFHVDAVQAIGKVKMDFNYCDLVTITGHKVHGLIGCGCLIKRNSIQLEPLFNGGGQEFGYRSGTSSLPLFGCLAIAIKDACLHQDSLFKNTLPLAKKVDEYIKNNSNLYESNSHYEDNPFIYNFSLKQHKASVLVEALSERNIMVSSVSACHSKGEAYSYVVEALKHDRNLSHNTIRISFDDQNSLEDVDTLISNIDEIIRSLKQ